VFTAKSGRYISCPFVILGDVSRVSLSHGEKHARRTEDYHAKHPLGLCTVVGIPSPTLAISDAAIWHGKATTHLLCRVPAFIMFNFVFCPLVPYLRSSCSNSLPCILVPDELCILPSGFRMNPLRVCEGLLPFPSKGRGYPYFNT
jgi:hypothetical protein